MRGIHCGDLLAQRLPVTDRLDEPNIGLLEVLDLLAKCVEGTGEGDDEQHRAGHEPGPEVPPPHTSEESIHEAKHPDTG